MPGLGIRGVLLRRTVEVLGRLQIVLGLVSLDSPFDVRLGDLSSLGLTPLAPVWTDLLTVVAKASVMA